MYDDPKRWANLTEFGDIPQMKEYLTQRPKTTNGRVVADKLKEKLLTGKPQVRRVKSAFTSNFIPQEGVAMRGEFPMKYTRADSAGASATHRRAKIQLGVTLQREREDSYNSRLYGLHMFDCSLAESGGHTKPSNRAPSERVQTPPDNKRPLSVRSASAKVTQNHHEHKLTENNGPSPDGGLINNYKCKLLNSIRLRPQSEPPSQFNHRKGSMVSPVIQQRLNSSNGHYRLRSASSSSTSKALSVTGSTISDLLLVPVDENGNNSCKSSQTNLRNNSFHESVDVAMTSLGSPRSDDDGSFEPEYVDKIDPPPVIHYSESFLRRNMPSGKVHLYSLEYESESDEEAPPPPPPVEEKPPTPPPEEPKGKGKGKGRAKSAAKGKSKERKVKSASKKKKEPEPPPPPSEPEPEVKPAEVRKPLRGPRCWVDDATITDETEKIGNDLLDTVDGDTAPVKCVTIVENDQAQASNKKLRRGDSKGNMNPQPPERLDSNLKTENLHGILAPAKPEVAQDKPEQITVECIENESSNIRLPSYICPSSERKSKENEIKHWLFSTDFHCAKKMIPLF